MHVGAHCAWWDSQYPGDYEHWRFADGFIQGWDDAYTFFALSYGGAATVSEIGFKGAWAKRRAAEHARQKGDKGLWEFGKSLSIYHRFESVLKSCINTRARPCARRHCGGCGRATISRLMSTFQGGANITEEPTIVTVFTSQAHVGTVQTNSCSFSRGFTHENTALQLNLDLLSLVKGGWAWSESEPQKNRPVIRTLSSCETINSTSTPGPDLSISSSSPYFFWPPDLQ